MFPFSYSKRIIVSTDRKQKIDIDEILLKFKEQFYESSLKSSDTITFNSFNFSWRKILPLDNGILKISKNDNQVFADLNLRFYTTPVIILLLSLGLAWMCRENIWAAFLVVAFLWMLYLLGFLLTIIMFKFVVKRIIGYHLFSTQPGLEDDQKFIMVKDMCPGCGSKLHIKKNECTECGLYLGGE